MKVVLNGLEKFQLIADETFSPRPGCKTLEVEYCGVCRTDAKNVL